MVHPLRDVKSSSTLSDVSDVSSGATGGSGVGYCASAAATSAPERRCSIQPSRSSDVHHNSSDIPSQSVRVPHIVCRASELGSGDVQHPLPLGSEHWMLVLVPQDIVAL